MGEVDGRRATGLGAPPVDEQVAPLVGGHAEREPGPCRHLRADDDEQQRVGAEVADRDVDAEGPRSVAGGGAIDIAQGGAQRGGLTKGLLAAAAHRLQRAGVQVVVHAGGGGGAELGGEGEQDVAQPRAGAAGEDTRVAGTRLGVMPVNGSHQAQSISALLREPTAGLRWRDAHMHIGQNDPDGVKGTLEEILAGLDAAGHDGGLVYPMHEPGGYPPANDMIAEQVAASGGRLDWLCRVDPNAEGAVAEAARCLDAGAAGIKLHPRSDAFGLPHPVVGELVALAETRRAPVLFHAGRGIPNLGLAAAELARRHPGARIILAHAGISDLGLLAGAAAELPNLLFDTSWWLAGDLLTLLTTIPPGQILYASDMPYGPGLLSAFLLTRAARQAGVGEDALSAMAGAQLARVVAGEELASFGPAIGEDALGPRHAPLERILGHTAGAIQVAIASQDPTEPLSLARLGCQHEDGAPLGPLLDAIDELLQLALRQYAEAEPGDRFAIIPVTVAAHMLAATPAAGVPSATP